MKRLIPTVLFLALGASVASAQEPIRPLTPVERQEGQDAQERLRELFAKVERNLRRIDTYLSDAAAGDVPLELPDGSGIADLLRETRDRSRQTIDDINEILEIAQQQQQQGGGGQQQQQNQQQQQQQQQQGESPLDQQRSGAPQAPEPTPELPGEGQNGPKPEPQQPPQDGKPEGGEESNDSPENRAGEQLPEGEQGEGKGDSGDGARWGELPPRVREIFRSQGGGDLPVQYRDWIDSYYRRLNRQR